VFASDRDTVEIRNLLALMPDLYGWAREAVSVDELLIREMNKRVLDGVPGTETLTPGEYRRGQNYVQGAGGRTVYTPPESGDVPDLMRQLAEWMRLGSSGLPPILVAGVAHLEFVAIHPFWDGNGRVARALSTYVMYGGGCDFRRFHSWETYLNANVGAYTAAIAASAGERYDRASRDYTPWLEYFTEALAVTLEDLRAEIADLRRAWDLAFSAGAELGIEQTQVQALALAAFYGTVTTDSYGTAVGVSRATAYRHLAELEGAGMLERIGRGRASRYVTGAALTEKR
jgi:Fic family protein